LLSLDELQAITKRIQEDLGCSTTQALRFVAGLGNDDALVRSRCRWSYIDNMAEGVLFGRHQEEYRLRRLERALDGGDPEVEALASDHSQGQCLTGKDILEEIENIRKEVDNLVGHIKRRSHAPANENRPEARA